MIQYSVIGTGSSGNCTIISDGKDAFFVDVGFTGKEMESRLDSIGFSHHNVRGILVTHNHGDHIRGVGVIARFLKVPVYTTKDTYGEMRKYVGKKVHYEYFTPEASFMIGKFIITPFAISHDTVEPVGFIIEQDDFKLGYCTDIGVVTEEVRAHLQGCTELILEFNHDDEMLENGPYPQVLRERVAGDEGHLSNLEAEKLLASIISEKLRHVTMIHLSDKNNTPELARFHAEKAVVGYETIVIESTQESPTGIVVC